jgi:hypothetical protein
MPATAKAAAWRQPDPSRMTENLTSHMAAFILDLLAPMLMTAPLADPGPARQAVAETIAAYRPQDPVELVNTAQILGFTLTALDDLRLSAAADLALPVKLKLRSNANALNRAARLGSEALERRRWAQPPQPSDVTARAIPAEPEPEIATSLASQTPAGNTPAPNQMGTEQMNRLHWAKAMRTHAARLRAGDARRLASDRKSSTLWANVLTSVANELTAERTVTPGMSKSELMRTTLMASGIGFSPERLAPIHHRSSLRKPAKS